MKPIIAEELNLEKIPHREITRLRIAIVSNGIADPIEVPVLVCKGKPGPIVGITAAIHGNELNGIPVIQELFKNLNPQRLKGTIVAVPVVNIPAFLDNSRYFRDGSDLNRLFPGKKNGNVGEFYVYQFMQKIVSKFEYLIDLHTASLGRVNSLYVRANMESEITAKLSLLQHPQIVVHNYGVDGTLRNAAGELGIPSITVEVGNPLLFQKRLIKTSLLGLRNVLSYLKMVPRPEKLPKDKPIVCHKSYWIYSDHGGILEVLPELVEYVKEGQIIARLKNVFGDVLQEYYAPEDGVVIGKSTNPVGEAGARILHLGLLDKNQEFFTKINSLINAE